MCGIAGIFSKSEQHTSNSILKDSMDSILNLTKHRGPDHTGIYESDFGIIGMNRLAIQDISNNGNQPIHSNFNKKKTSIVFNGEIYNFKKLKTKYLNDVKFISESDTEVILLLYNLIGLDFLNLLEGIFSLIIIDETNSEPIFIVARDKLGVKPLYYSETENSIVFCSELKGILKSGIIKPTISNSSIYEFLYQGSINQPNTIINEIKMFGAGKYGIYKNNSFKIYEYWNIKSIAENPNRNTTYNNLIQNTEKKLVESIESQLISSVDVGVFLSGGIDSSLLAAIASEISNKKLNSFTVGFEDDKVGVSELSTAKKTSIHLGTNHHEIFIKEKDILDDLDDFITSIDQPSVDGLNTYIVSKYTSKYTKVALSGTGGDELLAGYPWFRKLSNNNIKLKKFPHYLDEIIFRSRLGGKYSNYIGNYNFQNKYLKANELFGDYELIKLLNGFNYNHLLKLKESLFTDINIDNLSNNLEKTTLTTFKLFLQNQLLRDIDSTSMYNSLEVRVPYLDTNLISELAFGVNPNYKLGNYINDNSYKERGEKKIFFDISKKYLPENFDSGKKIGFTMPFDLWLKRDLKSDVEKSLNRISNSLEIFNKSYIENLYEDFLNNKQPWYKIWMIYILDKWLYNYNLYDK